MSVFSSWSYTNTCTVWEPSYDSYSQPSGWTRKVYSCSYKTGGDLANDSTGEEFRPATTFFLEATLQADADMPVPTVGAKIVVGTNSGASPPIDAETVREVKTYDPSTFGGELPDHEILTG